jgi:hypothetical protein
MKIFFVLVLLAGSLVANDPNQVVVDRMATIPMDYVTPVQSAINGCLSDWNYKLLESMEKSKKIRMINIELGKLLGAGIRSKKIQLSVDGSNKKDLAELTHNVLSQELPSRMFKVIGQTSNRQRPLL